MQEQKYVGVGPEQQLEYQRQKELARERAEAQEREKERERRERGDRLERLVRRYGTGLKTRGLRKKKHTSRSKYNAKDGSLIEGRKAYGEDRDG